MKCKLHEPKCKPHEPSMCSRSLTVQDRWAPDKLLWPESKTACVSVLQKLMLRKKNKKGEIDRELQCGDE